MAMLPLQILLTFAVAALWTAYGDNKLNADYTVPVCPPGLPEWLASLTGEDFIKQLGTYYIGLIGELGATARANAGKPVGNYTGFYLSQLIQRYEGQALQASIANGTTIADESNCISILNATYANIFSAMKQPNDPIPGAPCDQLTGEGRYRYVLQQLGQVWSTSFNMSDANVNTTYPGTYLLNMIEGSQSWRRMQSISIPDAYGSYNTTACLIALKIHQARRVSGLGILG